MAISSLLHYAKKYRFLQVVHGLLDKDLFLSKGRGCIRGRFEVFPGMAFSQKALAHNVQGCSWEE